MREERWHRPGLVGPIILIFVGLVFLLANLGVLQVSGWWLLRLWPLVLVLAGLDILARHSRVGTVLVAVLALALVGGVIYLLATNPEPAGPPWRQAALQANPVSSETGGAKRANVSIRMGVGELRLSALGDSSKLFEGNLRYPGNATPTVSYEVKGDEGWLRLASNNRAAWVFPVFAGATGENWEVGLSPRIPLYLTVEGGASWTQLDLRNLQLRDLTVKGGVGRLEVQFPEEASQPMTGSIDGGVGEVVLIIPRGLEARLTLDAGLGAVHIDNQRLIKHGNVYETEGYATATNRLDLDVDGGVGAIRVK